MNCNIFQIIVTCACEEANPEVSKEYEVLRRMIDCEENFLEVKALGEDLAMQVLKQVSSNIQFCEIPCPMIH